jgi:alpha-D-ribose 1-methylphosphonate 5-triphosphate synthase subunit PhnG
MSSDKAFSRKKSLVILAEAPAPAISSWWQQQDKRMKAGYLRAGAKTPVALRASMLPGYEIVGAILLFFE